MTNTFVRCCLGGREGAVGKIEKIRGSTMLKVIKQRIQHNWSKTWFDFQLKITKRVIKNNRGEGTIKGALTALTVGVVPIDYIFFKSNEEKYSAQLSMLNTLLHENLLTLKEYEKVKGFLKQKYKVA